MGRGLWIDVIVYGRVIGTDCRPRANLNELEVYVCRRSTHHAPKHTHHSYIHSLTHSFRSAVHQIHNLFQSEFSAECELELLKISSIYSLTLNIPSLARQRCLLGWGPRRTPWFFCNFSTV